MPYASNGKISQDPIDGGIEITEEQYQEALNAILSGMEIVIIDGEMVMRQPQEHEDPGEQHEPTLDEQKVIVKAKRDGYLIIADKATTRHRDQVDAGGNTDLTAEQYLILLGIKQALRDIPEQSGFPTNVVWPEVPSFLNFQE